LTFPATALTPSCRRIDYTLLDARAGWLFASRSDGKSLNGFPIALPVPGPDPWRRLMDLFYIVVTVVFFAISAAYVRGCDHL
jgi:hypothetical protein